MNCAMFYDTGLDNQRAAERRRGVLMWGLFAVHLPHIATPLCPFLGSGNYCLGSIFPSIGCIGCIDKEVSLVSNLPISVTVNLLLLWGPVGNLAQPPPPDALRHNQLHWEKPGKEKSAFGEITFALTDHGPNFPRDCSRVEGVYLRTWKDTFDLPLPQVLVQSPNSFIISWESRSQITVSTL